MKDASIIIFYAEWCGHCKRAMPAFKQLKQKYPDRVIMKDSEDPETDKLMEKYDCQGFPSVVKQSSGDKFEGERTYNNLEQFLLGV